MKQFSISKKPQILFGEHTSNQVGQKFKEFGCTKVLVVCDPTLKKMGLFQHVFDSLDASKIDFLVHDEVIADPPAELVEKAARNAIKSKADGILGMGGGSCMDVAKGVNNLIHNDVPISTYYCPEHRNVIPKPGVPLILVPTTSGTGSEVSDVAVFYDTANHMKRGTKNPVNLSTLSIVDPVFGKSMSPTLTGQSGLDAIEHAIECMTAEKRNLMSATLAAKSIELVRDNLPKALLDGTDMEARANLSFAGMAAAMGFTDAGTHIGHMIAHQIGAKYHIPHGECCAMVAPALLAFLDNKMPEEIRMIANALGVSPGSAMPGRDAGNVVLGLARRAGLRSAAAWGIKKEELLAFAPVIHKLAVNQGNAPEAIRKAGESGCAAVLALIAAAE